MGSGAGLPQAISKKANSGTSIASDVRVFIGRLVLIIG
jgi:hypothetical protein